MSNGRMNKPLCKCAYIDYSELNEYDHTVYYQIIQVGNCIRSTDFRKGLRLAVMENYTCTFDNIHDLPQNPKFYIGTVTRIWKDEPESADCDIITITYDSHPYALDLSASVKHLSLFCIPLPKGFQ